MEFLEIPLFDDDVFKLLVRFAINAFFLSLITIFAIRPIQRDRTFTFTAVMMNITVFFICFALKKLDLGLGMALGLFAIFGVLRYRTDAIGIQEMTYLFIVIGIAVINSLSNKSTSYMEVALVNTLILATALFKQYIMGRDPHPLLIELDKKDTKLKEGKNKQTKYTIDYDRLEYLSPTHQNLLLGDLRERTGLNIAKVQIQHIDLPNRRAILSVAYDDMPVETA
jgi:hypothetical protein